jgi:hypothetical protein
MILVSSASTRALRVFPLTTPDTVVAETAKYAAIAFCDVPAREIAALISLGFIVYL